MNRDHCIIMYVTTAIDGDYHDKHIRCFACIGREHQDNLCSDSYLRNINSNYVFQCGVHGYNKDAIRKTDIEHFNNSIHKIIMTTTQCFLCNTQCKYPIISCGKISKTIEKYKEVVGII